MPSALERSFNALRTMALAYPEAHEEFPWGHSAIKVKAKAFVFLSLHEDGTQLSLSVKLPHSSEVALLLPFATPTGYGLGPSGWVTAAFGKHDEVPLDMFPGWIDESYRAIAPARLAKQVGITTPEKPTTKKVAKKTTAKKTTAKKIAAKKPATKKTAKAPAKKLAKKPR